MGAYDYGHYRQGMDGRKDVRLGQALLVIKVELAYNGFSKGLLPTPVFGEAAANRLGEFQASRGLVVDKQGGPTTLKELFRNRVEKIEDQNGFDRGVLGKLIWHESAFDPVAIGGSDPDDTGMSQINLRIHSTVTKEQAFDPTFALNWSANYISSQKNRIESEIDTLKAARASYNIGEEYAKQWLLKGFPATGGPKLGNDDSFKRATDYIRYLDETVW